MAHHRKTKFDGCKPLIMGPSPSNSYEHYLRDYNSKTSKGLKLIGNGEIITKKFPTFVFGIASEPEDFTKHDFLFPYGNCLVVHDRVLKILKEMCPHDFQVFPVEIKYDFQVFPVEIKSENPMNSPFVNKEFHLINVTNKVEALDLDQSYYVLENDQITYIYKYVHKENCMGGHLLAIEAIKPDMQHILFHPSLAKKFCHTKSARFLSDVGWTRSLGNPLPDKALINSYRKYPHYNRWHFITYLNNATHYKFLKLRIAYLPIEVLLGYIKSTLELSDYHREQCDELLKLAKNTKKDKKDKKHITIYSEQKRTLWGKIWKTIVDSFR